MQRELSVVVFDKNETSSELISFYLKEQYANLAVRIFSEFTTGYDFCKDAVPDMAFVDVSESQEFAFDIVSKLTNFGVSVIVTSISSGSNTIIKALRAGAVEFLVKPVIKQDLYVAVKNILNPKSQKDAKNDSRLITLFSGKGGSGKTVVASNLALELAKQTGKKTLLLDLNFALGELSEFMDLRLEFSLSNLLENIERVTSEQILEMASRVADSELYLLAEPENGLSLSNVTLTRLMRCIKLLKEQFAYIIIDTPTYVDEKIYKVLENSDYILFVASVNSSAMKNTKKCIELLKRQGVDGSKIKILLNRYIDNPELTIEEIELELGHPVYKRIPNNYFTVMSAINKKVSVSIENANSNVAESFRELAIMLSDSIINNSLLAIRGEYEYKRATSE